jgi:hypothetical protein
MASERKSRGDCKHAFANHALALRCAGYAVLPVSAPDADHDGKSPLVKHWARWQGPPSLKAVENWTRKFPTANVGIVPGASAVVVADIDALDQVDEAIQALGDTPLQVATSRGRHLYYRAPDRPLPGTLQALGLTGEVKAGRSIIVAPPSLHRSGATYTLLGCHWIRPQDLPLAKLNWLDRVPAREVQTREVHQRAGRGHSRRHVLNDNLCSQVAFCDTLDELLDVARTRNAEGYPTCHEHEPMTDTRVIKVATEVWRDHEAGHLQAWIGRKVGRHGDEGKELSRIDPLHGSDAMLLLMVLRDDHSARCRRGETFEIMPMAMQKAGTIPGWKRKRFEAARDLLVMTGKIMLVREAYGRSSAEYTLPKGGGAV